MCFSSEQYQTDTQKVSTRVQSGGGLQCSESYEYIASRLWKNCSNGCYHVRYKILTCMLLLPVFESIRFLSIQKWD